jgi:two-component system nitrogen regulation response regulator GlnG
VSVSLRAPAPAVAGKPRPRKRILVVDDEETMRWAMQKALEKRGFDVVTLGDGELAVAEIRERDYVLVLMDIKMPKMTGFQALRQIREIRPEQLIVLMTAYGTMRTAIDAMKEGAFDYITKPFEFEQIFSLIEKAVMVGTYRHEVDYLSAEMSEKHAFGNIIGRSRAMQRVYKLIGQVAPTDLTVLIRGASGTGKELVAQSIHHYSRRSAKPLVIVNIAAVPPNLVESELFGHERGSFTGAVAQKAGKFELAHGGTLFLDEIGDMDYLLQSKILRVLQEQEFYRVGGARPIRVDVRVIAATNQNLEKMVAEGRFRRDLYYRLNAVPILLPELKDHKEDLPLLIDYFMAKFCEDLNLERKYLSSEAAKLLHSYEWPGNIRELENTLKRAMVLAPSNVLLAEHFPPDVRDAAPSAGTTLERLESILRRRLEAAVALLGEDDAGAFHEQTLRVFELPLLRAALRRTRGNKVQAAAQLGINRNTLNKKIKDLGIE